MADPTLRVVVKLDDRFTASFRRLVSVAKAGAMQIKAAMAPISSPQAVASVAQMSGSLKVLSAQMAKTGAIAQGAMGRTGQSIQHATRRLKEQHVALGVWVKRWSHSLFSIRHLTRAVLVTFLGRMLLETGTRLQTLGLAFRNLAARIQAEPIKAFKAFRDALHGTVSVMDSYRLANQAIMLGAVKSKKDLVELATIARRLGQAVGMDTTQAFEQLTTALGRQSTKILDNLGIVLKAEEAYEIYADRIGKTANELSAAEKRVAFITIALERSRDILSVMGMDIETAATKWQQFKAAVDDAATAIARIGSRVLLPLIREAARGLHAIAEAIGATEDIQMQAEEILQGIDLSGTRFERGFRLVTDSALRAAQGILAVKVNTDSLSYTQRKLVEGWRRMAAETKKTIEAMLKPLRGEGVGREAMERVYSQLTAFAKQLRNIREMIGEFAESAEAIYPRLQAIKEFEKTLGDAYRRGRSVLDDIKADAEALKGELQMLFGFGPIEEFGGKRAEEIAREWEENEILRERKRLLSDILNINVNIKDQLTQLAEGYRNFGDNVRATVVGMFRAMEGTVRSVVSDAILGRLRSARDYLRSLLAQIGGLAATALFKMVMAPALSPIAGFFKGLQHGGIVTKPTLALVGEAGPEAVIPLRRHGATAAPGFGGNVNVTFNIQAMDGPSVERTLMQHQRTIASIIRKAVHSDPGFKLTVKA